MLTSEQAVNNEEAVRLSGSVLVGCLNKFVVALEDLGVETLKSRVSYSSLSSKRFIEFNS